MVIVRKKTTVGDILYAKAIARGSMRSNAWLLMLEEIEPLLNKKERDFMRDNGKKLDHNLSINQLKWRNDIVIKYFGEQYLWSIS